MACEIALEYLSPDTVCGYVKNIGREGGSCSAHPGRLRDTRGGYIYHVLSETIHTREYSRQNGNAQGIPSGRRSGGRAGENMIQKVMLFARNHGKEGLLCEFLSEKYYGLRLRDHVLWSKLRRFLPGKIAWKSAPALWIGRRWKRLSSFRPQLVIDATHPYARLATGKYTRRLRVFKPSLISVLCRNPAGKKKRGGNGRGGRRDRRDGNNRGAGKTTGLTKRGAGKNAWPEKPQGRK